MKFRITKSSTYTDHIDYKPIDHATWGEYTHTDWRSVDDPSKLNFVFRDHANISEWWYSEGTNHRVEKGRIARDFIREGWTIEINTIEELVALHKLTDEMLTISSNGGTLEIEIWDE